MSGSQQANLSSNLNEQMIGIYLCWKEYTDGVATENRTYQFIPKGVPSGCAFDQFLTNRGAGLIGNKQVYVYDDRIVGDDNNSRGEYTASTTNLRMSNNRWVLAEIIGIWSSIVQIEKVTVNENISPKAQVYILIPAKAGYEIFSCALKITKATGAANALLLSQPMSSNGNLFTRIYNTTNNTVGLSGTVICYFAKL